jgi:hypothetical protein
VAPIDQTSEGGAGHIRRAAFGFQRSDFSSQLSAVSFQRSAFSRQLSAVSPSAFSGQPRASGCVRAIFATFLLRAD